MILDLHVHSIFSGDSPVRPEEYAEKMVELKSQGYPLDGFVLMEHNFLIPRRQCDLQALSEKYGLLILGGVELDTHWGHVLVFGIESELWNELQNNNTKKHDPLQLTQNFAGRNSLILVPAHPFRGWLGMGERSLHLPHVSVIEVLNGANEAEENLAAQKFAARQGLPGIGGSDAHFLPELGKALTRFERPLYSMSDLVAELKAGRCFPLTLAEARQV